MRRVIVGGFGGKRRFFFAAMRLHPHGSGIVEHDLDMVLARSVPWRSPELLRILNWLMPAERTVGPPMRSVLELEKPFPARDSEPDAGSIF